MKKDTPRRKAGVSATSVLAWVSLMMPIYRTSSVWQRGLMRTEKLAREKQS